MRQYMGVPGRPQPRPIGLGEKISRASFLDVGTQRAMHGRIESTSLNNEPAIRRAYSWT